MFFYEAGIHPVFFERLDTFFAVKVAAHVGNKAGLEAEPGGRDRGVRAVAYGPHDFHEFIRNFFTEAETELAVLAVNVTVDRGVFYPDKSVGGDVAYGDEVKRFLHGLIIALGPGGVKMSE